MTHHRRKDAHEAPISGHVRDMARSDSSESETREQVYLEIRSPIVGCACDAQGSSLRNAAKGITCWYEKEGIH